MCGLFGAISSTLTPADYKILFSLSCLSVLRGNHSSGFAMYGAKAKALPIVKGIVCANELMLTQDFIKATQKNEPTCIIGHARHATLGVIDEEHAHPFRYGHIIGAHNGTCNSIVFSNKDGGEDYDKHLYDSDSYLIYKSIATIGLQATLPLIKSGAYALTWIDLKQNRLFVLRNDQRPLYYVVAKGTVFWASERSMLDFALNRDNEHNVPTSFETDVIYSWDINKFNAQPHKEPLIKPVPVVFVPPSTKKRVENLVEFMKKKRIKDALPPAIPDGLYNIQVGNVLLGSDQIESMFKKDGCCLNCRAEFKPYEVDKYVAHVPQGMGQDLNESMFICQDCYVDPRGWVKSWFEEYGELNMPKLITSSH
jgi:predicted glutamine amidotransferase